MKLLLLFLLLTLSAWSYSQDLEGVWEGFERNDPADVIQSKTILTIAKKPDKSYQIYSYTKLVHKSGRDTIVLRDVTFKRNKKFIILEEKQIDKDEPRSFTLMKMYLKHTQVGSTEKLEGISVSPVFSQLRNKMVFIKLSEDVKSFSK